MAEFSAFAAFPHSAEQVPFWAFLRTNTNGQSAILSLPYSKTFGPCLEPSPPERDYPHVCKVEVASIERGSILEPGYLLLQPHGVLYSPTPEATIRFTAPESGIYHAIIELKTAELAYGGTSFRLYKGNGKSSTEILSQQIPRSYGHQKKFEPGVTLAKGETLSLSIGPSPNGDASSDGTLIRFDLTRKQPAFPAVGASLTVLAVFAVVLCVFLWKRWRFKPQSR